MIEGKVQGVFFRDTTRRKALELGVSGWVRNVPSGDVEAYLEGDEASVDSMLSWLWEGPPPASVEDVRIISREQGEREYSSFDVVR
jgi:acylphosphatase